VEVKWRLNRKGVCVREDTEVTDGEERALTKLTFKPKKQKLSVMQRQWNDVEKLLPDKGSDSVVCRTAEEFRKRYSR